MGGWWLTSPAISCRGAKSDEELDMKNQLIDALAGDIHCTRILRDWELFLGHALTSDDFQVIAIRQYLDSLRDALGQTELAIVRMIIDTVWIRGHELGILTEPPDWISDDVKPAKLAEGAAQLQDYPASLPDHSRTHRLPSFLLRKRILLKE